MLSTATTSNQHQPNFWFSGNPLPSFFSSSTTGGGGGTTIDKNLYLQQQPTTTTTNKILFDTNLCSSNSESSPPLSNDFLLTCANPATTLNLTQFNYIQQNHHHHSSSNHFLQRDDWSQIPITQTITSPTWTKGKENFSFSLLHQTHLWHPIVMEIERRRRRGGGGGCSITHIHIHLFLCLNGYSMIGRMIYNICRRHITSA
jgi:hypothetical protein